MGTKKRALAGLVAIIVVGVAGMALAAPQAGKGGPVFPMANLVKDLDLTEEQLAEIRGIEAECFEKTQALQTSLNTKMFELKQLRLQKDPDEGAIEAKIAEIEDLRKQVMTARQEAQERIKAVYTDEQLQKLREAKVRRSGMKTFDLVDDLGLTEEQLATIRDIEAAAFQKAQAIRTQVEEKTFELRQLQLQKDPDEAAIEAKRAEIGKLQEQLRAIQKESQEQVKGVYTQEQLDKINEMKPEGPGMGRGRGPGWKGRMKSLMTPGVEGTVTN